MATVECHSTRPIPHAVLKVQFKRLVSQHNQSGVILTRDLLMLLSEYEEQQGVMLLTPEQKTTLQPYCFANPELEMTADDILNLLKVMFPTTNSDKLLSSRPRTSAPLSASYRRPSSVLDMSSDVMELDPPEGLDDDMITSDGDSSKVSGYHEEPTGTATTEKILDEDENQPNIRQYYRRSLQLTRRLKESERSVALMTRDNEDRILQLQNRVDDMTKEVTKQKREIQEYKSKEESSRDQIIALEEHIDRIERSETDQKQIYLSIKRLFEEKCREAQELQDMLRHKETELQKTEGLLAAINNEFSHLNEERNRLFELQRSLEWELSTSHLTHVELEEQRTENERLKEIIDGLKENLDSQSDPVLAEFSKTPSPKHTLFTELEKDAEENSRTVKLEELDQMRDEIHRMKRLLELENKELMNEIEDLTFASSKEGEPPRVQDKDEEWSVATNDDLSATSNEVEKLASQAAKLGGDPYTDQTATKHTNEVTVEMVDIWTQSRIRQRKMDKSKPRVFQGFGGSTPHVPSSPIAITAAEADVSSASSTTRALTHPNDRAVTNTATFAIYTLIVYIFGIVTSTFLLENGHPGSWEQALVAAASQQGGSKSKILEIILYWIEKLLDGNIPLS
ncbi:hypothetical protein BX666DRAFT_2031890 [Dichotomocladium elegans]|nr:hypothetical protein BX666DRAFT_2031890 [Dichotomocladium elegans]